MVVLRVGVYFCICTFLLLCSSTINSQNVVNISNDCGLCELNNSFQHTKKIDFEGGNICCDRNFQLIFSDEFDGEILDTNKWATWYYYSGGTPDHTRRLHGNRGSYFKDENVIVGGGICTLRTKIEHTDFPETCFDENCYTSKEFTSGMLWGKQTFENFHRYEIRCNSPLKAFNKMWTAFWVFGWVTEIDFFEFNSSKKPEFSCHKWSIPKYTNASGELDLGSLLGSFHTYAAEHDKFFIRIYIDNELVYTFSLFNHLNNNHQFGNCDLEEGIYDRTMSFPDCNEPSLSVIVDPGATPNASRYLVPPILDSSFPTDFLIDYIRVYKIVSNENTNGCKYKISGPTSICKNIDTLQYCLESGNIDGGFWELPSGLTMYQNPSLTINSRTIFNGTRDTIVFDTIINYNCIKVIANGYSGNGQIKFKVPESCKFVNGDYISKKLAFGLPTPDVSYDLNTNCTSARICLNNHEDYSNIWFSDGVISEANKGCITIDVAFGKFSEYFVFVEVENECGKRLHPIRIDGRRCVENPINENLISVTPNPANVQFVINIDQSLQSSEFNKIVNCQIFNVNLGFIVTSYDINLQNQIIVDINNYMNGEYLLLFRDASNNFYSKRVIVNKN